MAKAIIDQQPGRRRYRRGPAQNKHGPVKNRADDYFSDLRAPIGRKLQRKRRGDSF